MSVSSEHNKSIAASSSIACSFAKAREVACSHLLEGFGMLRVHESTSTNLLRFDLDRDGWPGKRLPNSPLCLRNSNLRARALQERIQVELDLGPSEELSALSLRCNGTSPFRDVVLCFPSSMWLWYCFAVASNICLRSSSKSTTGLRASGVSEFILDQDGVDCIAAHLREAWSSI